MLRCALLVVYAAADRWQLLREGAAAWRALQFDVDFAVNVGDETGTLFRWESPGFSSATTRMEGASTLPGGGSANAFP